ncbi:MAG: plasma-membrane proton-efflux P-type ATPase [Deltaproteobacteria bacterium]
MEPIQLSIEKVKKTEAKNLMEQLQSTPQGLSQAEAQQRLEQVGANALADKERSKWIAFFGYLWGPIPWMIEVAAVLSLIVGHWVDLGIILALLLFNAAIGFWQEKQAGDAVAALKKKLALKCRVRREGTWRMMDAVNLVPGDIIRLRMGDIIPADAKLFNGEFLSVDQSALTGESLPVDKSEEDVAYSGSVVKKGEMIALVTATGAETYFGRTAKLVAGAGEASHFQKAVLQIGDYLIYLSLALVVILVLVQLFRGASLPELIQFALILTVASIPVAAALASKVENNDSIDSAIIEGLGDTKVLEKFEIQSFVPFDPVGKRTEATVKDSDSRIFKVTKGAPQVVMDLSRLGTADRTDAEKAVDELAAKGQRTLGVARTRGDGSWAYLGVIALLDPPREDSAETIAEARKHGIQVKMITGDNLAIAREIASRLGMGRNILNANQLLDESHADKADQSDLGEKAEAADGFAQVFPEHKYNIVRALQKIGHIVGMTGDGANDAPALKQADMGIAVSGATDAARSAADLVLTESGLSVIIKAVEEARRIFERMNSYAVYRITETIRIMLFVVLAMLVFNFYPITAIMIILLAFLNDVPIMTIAYDRTALPPHPVRWDMRRILAVSSIMGMTGVAGSFLMLFIGLNVLHLSIPEVQTYIFLKMAVAGHLTLFVSRSKGFFWKKPYPAPVMVWSAVVTKLIGTVLAAFGFGIIAPIGLTSIALIWAYSIFWAFLTDWVKTLVYRHFDHTTPRHKRFLQTVRHRLAPHSSNG